MNNRKSGIGALALLFILEFVVMLIGAVVGQAVYEYMLCGMAALPFLFVGVGLLN